MSGSNRDPRFRSALWGELKDEQLHLVLDGGASGLVINEADLPSEARA